MQKINLRDLYPDAYKTDVFVDVAEEGPDRDPDQQQDDAAYECIFRPSESKETVGVSPPSREKQVQVHGARVHRSVILERNGKGTLRKALLRVSFIQIGILFFCAWSHLHR